MTLTLAAVAGFCAYLIPLYDAAVASRAAHPSARARAIPLARYLQADHDLTATRGGLPQHAVLAALAEPGRLPRPVLVEPGRLAAPDGSVWRPGPDHRPDLSRSPPAR